MAYRSDKLGLLVRVETGREDHQVFILWGLAAE
jgi:hypothetical protein